MNSFTQPRKPAKKARQVLNIRATAEEIAYFDKAADLVGLNRSSWIRMVLLERVRKVAT